MRVINAEAFEKEMMNLTDKYSKKRPRLALALLFATDIAKRISYYAEINPENICKSAEWEGVVQSAFYGYDNSNEPVYRDVIVVCHCSLCGRKAVVMSNYCPNCGAKMKAEVRKK